MFQVCDHMSGKDALQVTERNAPAPAQELHQVYILIAEQHPTTSVPAGAETALAPSRRNRNFGTPQVLFYT
jgi:hypothetical protein